MSPANEILFTLASLLCGLAVDVVETAMLDNRPDMILILSKFAGISWTAVKSLQSSSRRGQGSMRAESLPG